GEGGARRTARGSLCISCPFEMSGHHRMDAGPAGFHIEHECGPRLQRAEVAEQRVVLAADSGRHPEFLHLEQEPDVFPADPKRFAQATPSKSEPTFQGNARTS